MNVFKRMMIMLLSAVMVLSMIPYMAFPAAAQTMTLSELQAQYPHGKYWNHYVSTASDCGDLLGNRNDERLCDSVTSAPCYFHGTASADYYVGHNDCNYFDGAWQCMGFARLLAFRASGTRASGWSYHFVVANIKPGDVIQYWKTGETASADGHSVFVTAVSGSVVTVAEANYGSNCYIRWGRQLDLNTVDEFRIYSSPKELQTTTSYTISYNANGGTGAPAQQVKQYNQSVKLSSTIPTRWGHTFLGWSTNSAATSASYQSGGTYTANGDVTLYAVWRPNTYTIQYNGNGATSGHTASSAHTVDRVEKLSANGFVKNGYTFCGWNLKADGSGKSYSDQQLVSNFTSQNGSVVTLYAMWEQNTYTISYNANGGTGAPASQTKTYGNNLTLSSTKPTRFGYVFLGWSVSSTATTASYSAGGTYTANESATLYAVWVADAYSGMCGDSAYWSFSDGTLSIWGSGDMTSHPWSTYNEDIKNVQLAQGITGIAPEAFYDCTNLTSITIPDSVTDIGDKAFYQCSSLTSIDISNKLKSIGAAAFYGCTNLTDMCIPNSVTSIRKHAFSHCSKLVSVTIPNGVTSIEEYVFYNCVALTSVTIPNSVTSIGDNAFAYCGNLKDITIPGGVTSIGDNAFYVCKSLTSITIPDGIKSISYRAFCGCNALKTVIMGNGVTNIADYAFAYGYSMENITIPNSVTSIGEKAFYNCNTLTDLTIPSSVKSVGYCAFQYCSNLKNLVIEDGVETIEGGAFYGCTNLTEVKLPNSVTSIKGSVFDNCTSLESVTIPETVTSIDKYAFYDCTGLASITIPDSVTNIGIFAFSGCSKLTDVWYGGGETERASIVIDSENAPLLNATWHYNTCSVHVYAGECDASCDMCEWTRESTVAHIYDNACDTDCNVCGATREVEDHVYGDWIVDKEPTTEAEGSKHQSCTICGHTVTETIPKLEKPAYDWTITQSKATLELRDEIFAKILFTLTDVDLTAVDLTKDAGMLWYTQEEFAVLDGNYAFDESRACVGLELYGSTSYYAAKSNAFKTSELANEYYYVGYVKLPDGSYIFSNEKLYGPTTYAYSQLSKSTSTALRNVCIGLINYAAAAQQQFGGVTDESLLVNNNLTAAQKALTWNSNAANFRLAPTVPSGKQVTANTTYFKSVNKTLRLQEKISLIAVYTMDKSMVEAATETGTIFWTAEQFAALSGKPSLTNIGDGQIVKGFEAYNSTGTRWCSAAPGVAAKDVADTTYYMLGYLKKANGTVVYSGVSAYTFEQYMYNQADKAGNTEALKTFVKRLYAYERAAREFLK